MGFLFRTERRRSGASGHRPRIAAEAADCRRRCDSGTTVVELMVALTVLLIAVLGAYTSMWSSTALARTVTETYTIAKDVEFILEDIRALPIQSISGAYPDGGSVPEFSGKSLTDERIVVTYPDGVSVRPLVLAITASWRDHRGETRQVVYYTARSR